MPLSHAYCGEVWLSNCAPLALDSHGHRVSCKNGTVGQPWRMRYCLSVSSCCTHHAATA
ncbi:Uncharacterised protein [Vibrio cholerae]|nr:Uncharacterised protein [Vibrio cholerae]